MLKKIFDIFSSLKLAVIVLVSLALSLVTATFLESLYDTPTSQYWVYRSFWFYGLLALLGVNIFCVAMSRYPWKFRHGPFLMAHAGILTLLFGSLLTFKFGLDGNLRVTEGQAQSIVELSDTQLAISEGNKFQAITIPWIPPNVKFRPVGVPEYSLTVDQYLPHAEPVYLFKADPHPRGNPRPAIKFKLAGGPMRIQQDFWLWMGEPSWSATQAGPARLQFGPDTGALPPAAPNQPVLKFSLGKLGELNYEAKSSSGEIRKGTIAAAKVPGFVIEPGWKGNVTITMLELIPDATNFAIYEPSPIQFGTNAPPGAIHVSAGRAGKVESDIWLGLGDRAMLGTDGKEIAIAYQPQKVILPFGIHLDRFILERYEGTNDPSRYSSMVRVKQAGVSDSPLEITMNEPLQHQGITFYQASYEDAQPRPVTSVLSVNRDPGRPYKYIGSLMIVLGSIWLFASKYKKAKKA